MRRKTFLAVIASAALAAAMIGSTAMAKGPGGGNGGGGGPPDVPPGQDGTKPGGGGGKGDLYSDLVVAYRDVRGLPIMAQFGTEFCVQPVSPGVIDGLVQVPNPVDGSTVSLIPLMGELAVLPDAEEEEVGVCDPQPAYLALVTEVELERLNQGRSPSQVVDKQYDEVQAMITGAILDLEASGRLRADGVAIDSPLMNTAIYMHLMLDGSLTDTSGADVTLPTPAIVGYSYDALHHAAVALAMAAGKEVPISADTFVYHNRVLDIPARTTAWPTVTGQTACVLDGYAPLADRFTTCGAVGEKYINYTGFQHNRAATFTGCVRHLHVVEGEDSVYVVEPIMDVVFAGADATADNIAGVALHGDDARRVNLWIHDQGILVTDWDAPGEDTTCGMTP
jgi:hypothetical protein